MSTYIPYQPEANSDLSRLLMTERQYGSVDSVCLGGHSPIDGITRRSEENEETQGSDEVTAGSLLQKDSLPDGVGLADAEKSNLTGEMVAGGRSGASSSDIAEGGDTITTNHGTQQITLEDGNGRFRTYDAMTGEAIGASDRGVQTSDNSS